MVISPHREPLSKLLAMLSAGIASFTKEEIVARLCEGLTGIIDEQLII